jgi:hypothetical protein
MTERSLVILATGLLSCLASVRDMKASPVACPTTGTVQDLINTDAAGGCTISVAGGATLTFSGFAYTPSGTGTPGASGVTYTLDAPGTGIASQPIFGFELDPNLSVTGTVAAPTSSQSILLSYLVVPTATFVNSIDLLETATTTGTGQGVVTDGVQFCLASDPSNTSGTCRTFGTTPEVNTSTGTQDHVTFGNWTSMLVSQQIAASTTSAGSTATISDVREAVDLSAVVPEPTTYASVGIGLLALGYARLRRRGR